jgi:hypothetical protein
MGKAPYQHSYQRDRLGCEAESADLVPNSAHHLTDQGAGPDPADLGWCIRRAWRVLYYSHRQAMGQPLWDGVDDFEILMADVLLRLSSAFEPIAPIHKAQETKDQKEDIDARDERVYQASCRVYPAPVFRRRAPLD